MVPIGGVIRNINASLLIFNISQEELAHITGISWSHMGQIERGTKIAGLKIIARIAKALHCLPAQLLDYSPPQKWLSKIYNDSGDETDTNTRHAPSTYRLGKNTQFFYLCLLYLNKASLLFICSKCWSLPLLFIVLSCLWLDIPYLALSFAHYIRWSADARGQGII